MLVISTFLLGIVYVFITHCICTFQYYFFIAHIFFDISVVITIAGVTITVADLEGFQGFHGTPLLASVVIESYGSLAFSKTQLFRLYTLIKQY